MNKIYEMKLLFPEPYTVYNKYFDEKQEEIFLLKDKIAEILSDRTIDNSLALIKEYEAQIASIQFFARVDVEMALFEDEADELTQRTLKAMVELKFCDEAYEQYKRYKTPYKRIKVECFGRVIG